MSEYEEHIKEQLQRCGRSGFVAGMMQRLNLQSIGSFIRDGSTKTTIENDSFQQREEKAFLKLKQFLCEKYGEKEAGEIIKCVDDYINTEQEIYFNLGIKTGAILQCKLTNNFETDI